MRKHSDEQWDLLKTITPGADESKRMKSKLIFSIRSQTALKEKHKIFELKNIVLTALFLFISAGLMIQLQKHYQNTDRLGQYHTINDFSLKWDLESVYSEKNEEDFALFEEGNPEQVGMAEFVTDGEKEKIINTSAIHMSKEMEKFPYPTTLYIEHVKMMDVALRYHFFVEAGKEIMHFSFDYPKLDYAEIFQVISSLDFVEPKPYRHNQQLYVNHGYGKLPYPVGLTPVELIENTEKYEWEKGSSPEKFKDYVDKIKSTGEWKQINGGGSSYTFESNDGLEIVTISINGQEILYKYSYPNREE